MDGKKSATKQSTFRKAFQKVGRNEPCPCMSGKKFKKCCYEKYNDIYVEEEHGISKDTL